MIEFDLETMANVAELFGACSIATALIFGTVQLREFRRRRRDFVAADLMRSFHSADLAEAVSLLRLLPDGITAAELRDKGPEYEKSAIMVTTTFETMGLLVFRRIAPFSLVEQLAGGMILVMWRKVRPWLDTVREEQSQPSWAEWFQWLAEQLAAVEVDNEPAHLRYRNWNR